MRLLWPLLMTLLLLFFSVRAAGARKTYKVIPNRKISRIVVHHTAESEGITLEMLSRIGYWRLYARHPWKKFEPIGTPRYDSGHWREINDKRKLVFYAYHWIIHPDGNAERLLVNDEVGFHAGGQAINESSVGVCFDGNFSEKEPSAAAIATAKRLIAWYRGHYPIVRVLAHCDVRNKTKCPGLRFRNGLLKQLTH